MVVVCRSSIALLSVAVTIERHRTRHSFRDCAASKRKISLCRSESGTAGLLDRNGEPTRLQIAFRSQGPQPRESEFR
jgi:hypothetical protein